MSKQGYPVLKIFFSKSFYYVQSRRLMTQEHRLVAPQISLASQGAVLKSSTGFSTGAFFPSLSPHFLHSDEIVHTFLLSPACLRARALASCHEGPILFGVSPLIQDRLGAVTFSRSDTDILTAILEEVLLGLLPCQEEFPLDGRIAECIRHVNSLKAERVSAADLAKEVNLSPSRFLHLFKREMKVTLRQYLMWKRCVEGGVLVAKGASVTEAALNAGFSDSAHFSRVFKKLFGITLSSALQERRPLMIGNPFDEQTLL